MSEGYTQKEPTQESLISELQEVLNAKNLGDLRDIVEIEANIFRIPCREDLIAYLVITDGKGRKVLGKCCKNGELVDC